MPIVERAEDENVPPVVTVAAIVNLSCDPSLWYSHCVNDKCDDAQSVHSNHTWNKDLQGRFKELLDRIDFQTKRNFALTLTIAFSRPPISKYQ